MRRRLVASLVASVVRAHHRLPLPSSSLSPPSFSSFSLRAMSAAVAEAPPAAKKPKTAYGEHTREAFLKVYEQLRDEIVSDPFLAGQPEAAKEWMKKMCDYNVPGGKLNRGMAVADVLGAIRAGDKNEGDAAGSGVASLSPEDAFDANVVGWCIEFLQAFFLVADDIMDGSVTRRGQPCWFRRPEVGMVACNDYILLECVLYRALALHFGGSSVGVSGAGAGGDAGSNGASASSRRTEAHPAYGDLVALFHDVTYQTAHGQLLDLLTAGEAGVQHHDTAGVASADDAAAPAPATGNAADRIDLSRYTMEAYTRIVTYKTAFYTIYMPVAAGMLLAGVPKTGGAYDLARRLCVEMGRYFQIQDDYLDLYGDPAVIGKVGTDIEDGKCCWLVCKALEIANEEQREAIAKHYGRKGEEHTSAIKKVYLELKIEEKFREYEQASHESLVKEVDSQTLLPKEVFHALLRKIYKRNK